MPLQDLTPQLRTRLSRVERAVGWFISLATLLLLAGFIYYVYHTAESKGWFLTKVDYCTGANDAAGLKVGDPIRLMGRRVGEIMKIQPNGPKEFYNVTIFFRVEEPNFGYLWSDSEVKIASSDFLGNRHLELTKGQKGLPTVLTEQIPAKGWFRGEKTIVKGFLNQAFVRRLEDQKKDPVAVYFESGTNSYSTNFYQPQEDPTGYWLNAQESSALADDLAGVVKQVKDALPSVFALTNQVQTVLSNATAMTIELSDTLSRTRPMLTNLALITHNLTNRQGALGEWLIPTNLNADVHTTLLTAGGTLTNADAMLLSARHDLESLVTNLIPILD